MCVCVWHVTTQNTKWHINRLCLLLFRYVSHTHNHLNEISSNFYYGKWHQIGRFMIEKIGVHVFCVEWNRFVLSVVIRWINCKLLTAYGMLIANLRKVSTFLPEKHFSQPTMEFAICPNMAIRRCTRLIFQRLDRVFWHTHTHTPKLMCCNLWAMNQQNKKTARFIYSFQPADRWLVNEEMRSEWRWISMTEWGE